MASQIFLFLESSSQGVIQGSVTQSRFEDLIEVFSTEHEVESSTDLRGRRRGRNTHHPFAITKGIDRATVPIYAAWNTNEQIVVCRIECYKPSASGSLDLYYTIELEGASISSIKQQLANPALSTVQELEIVTFSYKRISWTFAAGDINASSNAGSYRK